MTVAIAWLRSSFRLDDQPLLTEAAREGDELLIVAERSAGPRAGPHRATFHAESLRALDLALGSSGQRLYVLGDDPVHRIPGLATRLGAEAVYVNASPGTEESRAIECLARGLPDSCRLHVGRDNRLFDCVPLEPQDWPMSFSKFRRRIETGTRSGCPEDAPSSLPPAPSGAEWTARPEPVARSGLFEGGEVAGRERLLDYVFERRHVLRYEQTRNGLLSADDSSRFSPWLAHGCLSVRRVWSEIERFEAEVEANGSTRWLKLELLWREYFRWLIDATGSALFRPAGLADAAPDCAPDESRLQAWREGCTGVPLIDAAMRELDATGYVSNRARQNAASFLVKDLRQDWRAGAAWFERQLVDFDVASNWGNWAYQAGTGTDTRDRWFNVVGQARRYDREAAYLAHWLPELRALEPAERFAPWRAALPPKDYPTPLIDDRRWP